MSEFDAGDFTLGVEEEYQLVDGASGELRSRARAVLATDWTGEMRPEMQQNTVEVGTRVCRDVDELRAEVGRLRFQAAVAAEARGLRVLAAGTHPFSHWEGQEYTDGPVYERIRREYRRLADSQNIFGLHVHVAVPLELDRVLLMNAVRHYLPHLLALSASSPFYLASNTGYQSYRAILWRRWPRTGAPPRFRNQAEFGQLLDALLDTGRIDGPGRIYWDLRPHHLYPTLEFRVADVTPRVEDGVAVAALARLLVAAAADGRLHDPAVPEPMVQTLLSENTWRAARDGLDAELVSYDGGKPEVQPAGEALQRLVERLRPVERRLGDAKASELLQGVLERGTGAARMCRRAGEGGELVSLVRWLADETVLNVGLDRRTEQRNVS